MQAEVAAEVMEELVQEATHLKVLQVELEEEALAEPEEN